MKQSKGININTEIKHTPTMTTGFFSNIISISRLGINYFMLEHQILPQNNCDRIPFGIIGFKLIF